MCIFPEREPIAIISLSKELNVPKYSKTLGSWQTRPGSAWRTRGTGNSRRGPASVLILFPSPECLGLNFLRSRPGEAGTNGRSPTFTGTDAGHGAAPGRWGAGGEGEGAEAALRAPSPGFRGRGPTRQPLGAPAALLPDGVSGRSQSLRVLVSVRRPCIPALLLSPASQPQRLWPSL